MHLESFNLNNILAVASFQSFNLIIFLSKTLTNYLFIKKMLKIRKTSQTYKQNSSVNLRYKTFICQLIFYLISKQICCRLLLLVALSMLTGNRNVTGQVPISVVYQQ